MADPVLLIVDHEADALAGVENELLDRYARHYRVRSATSAPEALAVLEELAAVGRPPDRGDARRHRSAEPQQC